MVHIKVMSGDLDGVYFLEDFDFSADNLLLPLREDAGKHGLVLVFAHWCGNCKTIKPEYRKLLSDPELAKKVRLYAVDGTGKRGDQPSRETEQQLMKRWEDIVAPMEFRGFPSVYLFGPNGKAMAEFDGQRTAEHLMQFLKKQIKDL